ncbi:hypothetical protein COT78_03165 [Candidatus Berkelbacteria bacterium CG10_big_fil_rev_8_21_14_0_10_43_13]|uniref:Carbonic anhydrase n=1 Tax=Candidatus Berkelbacteria bacterium CG10_big_fil_rev_8_21_14_0_10_43_13 TaxID=1974514 RepID=A0A2H0W849_9BACT|nr:MAG: hypothetical protein COT78_03165 [Candidatus Berkelbacteria bacterium CG10_big_fil_rev_8_21_14_0_10_43_13]
MTDLKNLHHWEVLAVACIDGRFIKRTIDWLSEQTGGVFDFRTEVGATKAIIDCESDRNSFCNVIETSLKLHSIKQLFLIDHIDCGAYGGSKEFENEDEEVQFHIKQLDKTAGIIAKKFPNIEIKKVFVGWNEIEFV